MHDHALKRLVVRRHISEARLSYSHVAEEETLFRQLVALSNIESNHEFLDIAMQLAAATLVRPAVVAELRNVRHDAKPFDCAVPSQNSLAQCLIATCESGGPA